ncbi:MAG: hypothetical protein HOV82_17160 [Streptomyces sp.]|nr:hypothetical protein [Streptomyces sp.]NUP36179.1 hypothetical protein [Streptomyces sp.]NUS75526.1 hypothetical protein [Streptomyces sp.]
MAIVWPLSMVLAAAGLCVVAPRRAPLLYLGPVTCTVAFITLAAASVAAVWSH